MRQTPRETIYRIVVLALRVAVAGAAATTAAAAAPGWIVGDPAAHVADPSSLLRASHRIGALDGVYAVLVAHRGELISEEYFREGARSKPHNMKSASKSLLSALVGIAVAEGDIDLDQPLVEILTQARGLNDPAKSRITVRHLVTMTSGLEATSYETYNRWIAQGNWVRGALELPLVAEPGTLFQYSTGNSHLLSAVVTAATGQSTLDYAKSKLLGPMGIRIQGWQRDPQGIYVGGNNLSLTPRDMAKFGQLFLDGGRWREQQLVPTAWVEESTRNGEFGLHPVYGTYGYLWWTDLVFEKAFTGVGYGGQYIFVSPEHEAVVVITSTLVSKGKTWTAQLFEILRNELLPLLVETAPHDIRTPRDPALVSLEHAIERARIELALLGETPIPNQSADLPAPGRTTSRVNLRQGPGTEHSRLTLLPRGAPLEASERSGEWYRVTANAETGWLHEDFVELTSTSWRRTASELRQDLAEFSDVVRPYLPGSGTAPSASPREPGKKQVDTSTLADKEIEALNRSLASQRNELELALASAADLKAKHEESSSAIAKLASEIQDGKANLEMVLRERNQLTNRLAAAERRATDQELRVLALGETDSGDKKLTASAELFLRNWAEDWARRDPDRLLANYSRDFDLPEGLSRGSWEGRIRSQVLEGTFSLVQVSDLEVALIGRDLARVRFREVLRTESNSVASLKEIDLIREGESWRILRELFLSP